MNPKEKWAKIYQRDIHSNIRGFVANYFGIIALFCEALVERNSHADDFATHMHNHNLRTTQQLTLIHMYQHVSLLFDAQGFFYIFSRNLL